MTKRLTIALVALAMFVLVAVLPVSATLTGTYYTVAPNLYNTGATVYIGEQHLDVTDAVGIEDGVTTIGWWASAASLTNNPTAPSNTITFTPEQAASFDVSPTTFVGYTGDWYRLNPEEGSFTPPQLAFRVADPTLEISVRDTNPNQAMVDVSGKSIPTGSLLKFQIGTNMYNALNAEKRFPVFGVGGVGVPVEGVYPDSDGYLDILVKTESGTTLTSLYGDVGDVNSLRALNVATSPYLWGGPIGGVGSFVWNTGALKPVTGEKAYPAGTYVISVQSRLNNMKDNYLSGSGTYTGKTVSEVKTITLVSDTVSITANKDSVVRTKPFSVTVTGRPSEFYHVWVKNTVNMHLGEYNNAPPVVTKYQDNVVDGSPITAVYEFGNGIVAIEDNAYGDGTYFSYARIKTSTAGTRVIEFSTDGNTKAQKYTIRVEQEFDDAIKSDEVDVKVEKGAVTIVAAGDQSYYLGEEIKLSGTNTESANVYLFIIGPNLAETGGELDDPTDPAETDPWTSVQADVLADNTWSYKWATSTIDLDAGTYTIYAVSKPVLRINTELAKAAYGTVSIIIKKPFVSATASQSTVAKGDRLYITGIAEGQPKAVKIWVLGKNFAMYPEETVNSDGSFKFELKQADTMDLASGQYFVVVQHPMQNNEFDIHEVCDEPIECNHIYVVNEMLGTNTETGAANPTTIFKLSGNGALQGSDAAEALVQGINDPNVDDTYTKLQFLVEEPIISIDPIGDKHVGDKFTITAKTNLAVDDEVLVQVYSSSFKPTQKSQSGEFSGATGTIKVTKGDTGMNKLSFDVDSSTFKPDEYIVTEDAVIQDVTGTALFNVLEGIAPTAVPTTVVTTVAPTTIATPIPTPTTVAPTPTKSPGYGALIALIGLGAVAFIVVRRH